MPQADSGVEIGMFPSHIWMWISHTGSKICEPEFPRIPPIEP